MVVFHVSEEPDSPLFEPRKAEPTGASLVWAIDGEHLRDSRSELLTLGAFARIFLAACSLRMQ
jgi:hypothetical protein